MPEPLWQRPTVTWVPLIVPGGQLRLWLLLFLMALKVMMRAVVKCLAEEVVVVSWEGVVHKNGMMDLSSAWDLRRGAEEGLLLPQCR